MHININIFRCYDLILVCILNSMVFVQSGGRTETISEADGNFCCGHFFFRGLKTTQTKKQFHSMDDESG